MSASLIDALELAFEFANVLEAYQRAIIKRKTASLKYLSEQIFWTGRFSYGEHGSRRRCRT